MTSKNGDAKLALIQAFYHVGTIDRRDRIVCALELPDTTAYVADSLPLRDGSPIHCLACQATSFCLWSNQIKLDDLLGLPVLVTLTDEDGGLSRLQRVSPAASPVAPPRLSGGAVDSSPTLAMGFSDAGPRELHGGYVDDSSAYQSSAPLAPPAPKPRSKPIRWRIGDLREAKLPDDLPNCVRELVRLSAEWQVLLGKAKR